MPSSLLIIDAGHSRTKYHHYSQDNIKRETLNNKPFSWPHISNFQECTECLLIGTNQRMNVRLSAHIKNLKDIPTPIQLGKDIRVPIDHNCTGVGSDRLANALGATQLKRNSNKLIVSAGSALVIDLVNKNGLFEGGLIGIGYGEYLKGMQEISPLLLDKDYNNSHYPATYTNDAVHQGWIIPTITTIKKLTLQNDIEYIFISGGDAKLILPYFEDAISSPYLGADAMAKVLGYLKD